MDLNNHGFRPNQSNQAGHNAQPGAAPLHRPPDPSKKGLKQRAFKDKSLINVVYVALLFSVTVVLIAALMALVFHKNNANSENRLVDREKYQAIFLNNGHVYFGKIGKINSQYITIYDLFYLRVDQPVQPERGNVPESIELVKFGCELHRPQDSMVVSRAQVSFWENLTDETDINTVPGGIKKYKKDPITNCKQQKRDTAPNENKDQPASSESNDNTGGTDDTN